MGEIRHSHRTPSRPYWTSNIAGSTTRLETISLTTGTTGLVLSWTVKRCHVIARVEPRTVIRAVHRTLSWPGQTYDDRLRQIQRLITSHTTINNCLHQIDNCLQRIRRLTSLRFTVWTSLQSQVVLTTVQPNHVTDTHTHIDSDLLYLSVCLIHQRRLHIWCNTTSTLHVCQRPV